MRIIYTFRKKEGFWFVNCPSDNKILESRYDSLIEAINNFLDSRMNLNSLDIVIPLSVPKPITFRVPIRKVISETPITQTVFDSWGDKPIPSATIEFHFGKLWIVAIPPYKRVNTFYFKYSLPDSLIFTVIKSTTHKPVRVINGALEHDVFIDLGKYMAHIYRQGQSVRMDFVRQA